MVKRLFCLCQGCFSSLLVREDGNVKEKLKQRILDLERLTLNREAAMEHYAIEADKRRIKFNKKLAVNEIK